MSDKTIGTNDAAYFVGRKGVLNWLNSFLQMDLTKVEDACSGVVHCQIMDCLYPGQVPLHKVNFHAKRDYEFIPNYKILQDVFTKLNIDKAIPVNKLIQGRYQDNLEFLQWMKRFFELNYQGQNYDPVARRKQAMNSNFNKHRLNMNQSQLQILNQSKSRKKESSTQRLPIRMSNVSTAASSIHTNAPSESNGLHTSKKSENMIPMEEYQKLQDKYKRLYKHMSRMKLTIDSLAKERDFYFDKLLEIEVVVSQSEEFIETESVKEILYATSEVLDDEEIIDETETLKNPEPMKDLDEQIHDEI